MTKGLHALNNLLLVHGNLEHMWACFFAALPLQLDHCVEKENLHAMPR